jgi:hypothetical protein
LALIATLPAHHGKPPPPKLSEDGITVRQKSRALFQRHRSFSEISRNQQRVRLAPKSGQTDIAARKSCANPTLAKLLRMHAAPDYVYVA